MVECRETGTAVGDPLEVEVVANCVGDHGVCIGSVKPDLSHSEGAAAITSISKAVVALEHQTLIPNIKFQHPPTRLVGSLALWPGLLLPLSSSAEKCQR